MNIKILGTGCAKCKKLLTEAERAIASTGQQVTLEKVETIEEIMKYGVLFTPALVVNGKVMSSGRIPTVSEIVGWLTTTAP